MKYKVGHKESKKIINVPKPASIIPKRISEGIMIFPLCFFSTLKEYSGGKLIFGRADPIKKNLFDSNRWAEAYIQLIRTNEVNELVPL